VQLDKESPSHRVDSQEIHEAENHQSKVEKLQKALEKKLSKLAEKTVRVPESRNSVVKAGLTLSPAKFSQVSAQNLESARYSKLSQTNVSQSDHFVSLRKNNA